MKILAIGNSFSEDATARLHQMAESAGIDIYVNSLYIGGCSLEMHANNIRANADTYAQYINGAWGSNQISIRNALLSEKWDIVTIQQASHFSGHYETYEPFGSEILDEIKMYAPDARIYFHRTWAYELDSTHSAFASYGCSQEKMYKMIVDASCKFCADHSLPIIPAGDVIQKLRQYPEFDYSRDGDTLCRDGFHISLSYGRYALAATWLETLTGVSIFDSKYDHPNTEGKKLDIVKKVVHEICGK